ncbi:IPT/TIG domain [Popillia japonica]
MFYSEDEPDLNNELEISNFKLQTAETVEAIVSQLMEKQRVARQAALVKQLECGCPDSTCADGKTCSHPMRRINAKMEISSSPIPSSSSNSRLNSSENNNQVSSTTGSGSSMVLTNNHSPRVYSRENRNQHSQVSRESSNGNTPPLVFSLSQIQGGGGLLILNSNSSTSSNSNTRQSLVAPVSVANFVCNTNTRSMAKNSDNQKNGPSVANFVCNTNTRSMAKNSDNQKNGPLILKQEGMDTNPSSCCRQTNQIINGKVLSQRETKMDVSNDNMQQSVFDYGRRQENMIAHQTDMVMSAPSTPSKHMDTSTQDDVNEDFKQNFCNDTVVLLGTDSRGSLVSKSDSSSIINGGFFNETLDLSQEDIQRTLSANMPMCSRDLENHQARNTDVNAAQGSTISKHVQHHQETTLENELNPMDFINNCDVVVSPTHVVDDDVFVNLDAFDMLGEFPDLEVLDSGHAGLLDVNPSEVSGNEKSHAQMNSNIQMEGTAKITDYSPEWAYPEGGVKVLVTGPWHSNGPYTVLVTGPWHSNGPYTVLFDACAVPTTLVQSGVLRCYCPAHEAGLATLQVATLQVACDGYVISNSVMFEYKLPPREDACDGYVISNSVMFEYKLPPREDQITTQEPTTERSNDNLLKFTLLQRLEAMDDRLQIKQEPQDGRWRC